MLISEKTYDTKADKQDIPALLELLNQVLNIHANARPDVFKTGTTKYSHEELLQILNNENSPVFVALTNEGTVCGYVFCQYHEIKDNAILHSLKYLYIDDLCVDQRFRGQKIGTALYEYALKQAQENNCQSVRLNVWALNENAIRFYQKLGLTPLKTTMKHKI